MAYKMPPPNGAFCVLRRKGLLRALLTQVHLYSCRPPLPSPCRQRSLAPGAGAPWGPGVPWWLLVQGEMG